MAAYITSYLRYNGLDERAIRAISGALIHRLYIDEPIPPEKHAEIVYDTEIALDQIPETRVIKMSRKEHVEKFFDDGTLQLGNFNYFNSFDHEEIGDRSEGTFVLVGRRGDEFGFAEIGGGFHYHAFCAYAGDPDPKCIERFGYDSYFSIDDVDGFSTAILKTLRSNHYHYSSCVYRKDKVVVGDVSNNFDFNQISDRLLELVSEAKFFVKPRNYSHQSEFRFIWSNVSDLTAPKIIKCPEAIEYCSRR